MKVHVRTACSFCEGEDYLPVRETVSCPGERYTQHRRCANCPGRPRLVRGLSLQGLTIKSPRV